jgi:long-chain acyl-CoA synthetase
MKGYYNRPDATSAVLQDGWFHTGDLGYFDSHRNLFITGRQKEVIVLSSGKNIYPEEIEQHYSKSASIKEICVMGLHNRPGEPVAERLHAVVVPNFEALRERKVVNAKEVIRFDIETLSTQLPSTKRILSYDIWQQDLPRTTTRKLKRFEIEERVRDTQRGADTEHEQPAEQPLTEAEQLWLEQPQVQCAIKVIREASRSGGGRIAPRNNLELDLGLDSMQRVELLMALQQELGAEVPESVVAEVYTVRELVDAVLARTSTSAPSATARTQTDWQSVLQVEEPDPDVIAASQRRPMFTAAAFLFTRLLQLFFRDFFRLRVTGAEKLPAQGPFILCPNHQSYFDPAAVLSVLPWKILLDLFSLGTTEIFGSGIARRIARILKIIPVDPDASLVSALRAGAYGLRRGKILLLFPEGERSIDGSPRAFKKGVAILAANLQMPIYPVALDGFFDAWPRGKPFQGFFPVRLAFGDPIVPPALGNDPEATYDLIITELKTRVAEMWSELREKRSHSSLPNS